jgi:hypothetical protein
MVAMQVIHMSAAACRKGCMTHSVHAAMDAVSGAKQ